MLEKTFEYHEGFRVEKAKYFEAYTDEETGKMNQKELKEQLEIEVKRYHAIQNQIKDKQDNIKLFQGPSDSRVNLDGEDINRLEREEDLRANNIVKLCNRLNIEMIDLRSKEVTEGREQKTMEIKKAA
jgi:DNA-binding Xre family transcriptional regulator